MLSFEMYIWYAYALSSLLVTSSKEQLIKIAACIIFYKQIISSTTRTQPVWDGWPFCQETEIKQADLLS